MTWAGTGDYATQLNLSISGNEQLDLAMIVPIEALAFKKIDFAAGIWKSPWVGLQNFEFSFKSRDAFIITRNTLLYNICFIVLGNILGIIVGICLNEIFSKKLQKLFQTIILLPQLISMVIVAYIVYGFLSNEAGFVNKTILYNSNPAFACGGASLYPAHCLLPVG